MDRQEGEHMLQHFIWEGDAGVGDISTGDTSAHGPGKTFVFFLALTSFTVTHSETNWNRTTFNISGILY